MDVRSDVSAVSALQHYFHIELLLNNHADILVDDWYENAWGWEAQVSDTFSECSIVLTSGLSGNTKSFSLDEIAKILGDYFPDDFHLKATT